MVVVFDIGNTNVRLGLYVEDRLERKIVYRSAKRLPGAQIRKILSHDDVEGIAIVSVVPHLTKQLIKICRVNKVKTICVSPKSECGLTYRYRNPNELGADRIAALVGALTRYKRDVIVVDAGTAITIDVARKAGDHLGGIICPGIHMLSESIHKGTAQLPKIKVTRPRNLIGRSTEDCIRSGIFNGTMAMLNGLIHDIKEQIRGDFCCVATGGLGDMVARHVDAIDEYDENLCMYGALNIYYRNA
jgi:type III pantothenate kinase